MNPRKKIFGTSPSAFDYSSPDVLKYAQLQKELLMQGELDPRSFHQPKFICIGAQKSGTTWLYINLKRHPKFRFKAKEIHYFDVDRKYAKPLEYYSNFFKTSKNAPFVGDITPGYGILEEERIRAMHTFAPNAKLIMLMRHPVDRAWSAAQMAIDKLQKVKSGEPSRALIEKLMKRETILLKGKYLDVIDRFTKYYPVENLFLGYFEQIKTEPVKLLQDILAHLGVPGETDFSDLAIDKVVNERKNRIEIPDYAKSFWEDYYREDIQRMKEKFGKPVEHW